MEKIEQKILEDIGLTKSEIKVYNSLLKIGTCKKGELLKEAKIATSKVYDVMNKLIDKGLASIIIKNNVRHFSPAPPSRIKDYLSKKREEIIKSEKLFDTILPKLSEIQKQKYEETKVEVFIGWKGMETVYINLIEKANKGDFFYIFGAGKSENEKQLERFFIKYGKTAIKKGVKIKVIFDKNSKEYIKRIEKKIGKTYDKKFLYESTPSEVLIYKEGIVITIRKKEPIVILIYDIETAKSFLSYFNELWKNSKP